jgi:RNA 2',3'-cyclic 3'-phosphodiesterase
VARLRTFLAVHLGARIRDNCVDLQETLAGSRVAVKWVEPDNLHLTLLFLGEVDERDLAEVCREVQRVCATLSPFELCVEGVGHFGSWSRVRTVWTGVTTGADELLALHHALEEALLELGCYRREARQFTPHVTLGRVQGDRPTDDLSRAITREQKWTAGETTVSEVRVLSSELLPTGPVYTVLSRAALGSR